MIKEAMQYITGLAKNEIHDVNGDMFSDKELHRIMPHIPLPKSEEVHSLDAIVKLVKSEINEVTHPVYVEIVSHAWVSVYTGFVKDSSDYVRQRLYSAKYDMPQFRFDWKDYESAMIALRAQFAQDENIDYILNLLSKITDENSVATADNGLSQTIDVKKGISLAAKEKINPIVKLRPYRTFLEIEQPASEFLLRLGEGGKVGLFEADGGMWMLTAKRSISEYFEKAFEGIEDVVVMV